MTLGADPIVTAVSLLSAQAVQTRFPARAKEFDRAPFGIIGLETAVPLSIDRLVHAGTITLSRLVELMSVNPARILRVQGGSLAVGMRPPGHFRAGAGRVTR